VSPSSTSSPSQAKNSPASSASTSPSPSSNPISGADDGPSVRPGRPVVGMPANERGAVALRKQAEYYAANLSLAGPMPRHSASPSGRRGITVLGLVLLVLAVIVAIVVFSRYYPI
jgi:hypothetical protein